MPRRILQVVARILLFAVSLASFFWIVKRRFPGLIIQLGGLQYATPGYLFVVGWWSVFGTFAAVTLALLIRDAPATPSGSEWSACAPTSRDDATWIGALSLVALLAAIVAREWLLVGAAVTDDEASYRFAAQLLASGRLWVESPPMKLHFDHAFLINDGRLQSIYFLGWPALEAPWVWLGAPGSANAFYFAAGVAPFFLAARRFVGCAWARVTALLFATSPFLIVLAATELSHTSCITALAWALYFYLRTRESSSGAIDQAGFATFLSIAFFVRPISAVGVGGPLLLLWLADRVRSPNSRHRAILSFAAPAFLFALLFLGAQQAQHGSFWRTGYAHGRAYNLENDFRFTPWSRPAPGDLPGLDFGRPLESVTKTANGLLRFAFDLNGWPLGLALLGLVTAVTAGSARAWAMLGGGVAAVFFQKDPGIDTFGPLHYSELALPVYLLLGFGSASVESRLAARSDGLDRVASGGRRRVVALLVALSITGWSGFIPVRWATLHAIARRIQKPIEMAERELNKPAIVFATFPWQPCPLRPLRHYRWLRPIPDPDLEAPLLWVNHVDIESDRRLARLFPGRTAYMSVWFRPCEPAFVRLDSPKLDDLPPGPFHLGR